MPQDTEPFMTAKIGRFDLVVPLTVRWSELGCRGAGAGVPSVLCH